DLSIQCPPDHRDPLTCSDQFFLLRRERRMPLGVLLAPVTEDAEDGAELVRPPVALEDAILHAAYQPIVAVHARPCLRRHERLIRHLRASEVDAYTPSGAIYGLARDARAVLPVDAAARPIPSLD